MHWLLVLRRLEKLLEETVQREVMEETGLHVKNIRYYKSQPWGIVDDILAGFIAMLMAILKSRWMNLN